MRGRVLTFLAEALSNAGRADDAEAALREVAELAAARDDVALTAYVAWSAALVACRRGDLAGDPRAARGRRVAPRRVARAPGRGRVPRRGRGDAGDPGPVRRRAGAARGGTPAAGGRRLRQRLRPGRAGAGRAGRRPREGPGAGRALRAHPAHRLADPAARGVGGRARRRPGPVPRPRRRGAGRGRGASGTQRSSRPWSRSWRSGPAPLRPAGPLRRPAAGAPGSG